MRILLTGASGQVGHALHKPLQSLGTVLVPERHEFDLSYPDRLPPVLDFTGARFGSSIRRPIRRSTVPKTNPNSHFASMRKPRKRSRDGQRRVAFHLCMSRPTMSSMALVKSPGAKKIRSARYRSMAQANSPVRGEFARSADLTSSCERRGCFLHPASIF